MVSKLVPFFENEEVKRQRRLNAVKAFLSGGGILLILSLASWWPVK